MKRLTILLSFAFGLLCIAGCLQIKDIDYFVPTVTSDLTDVAFTSGGGTESVNITSNCTWTVECAESWVEISTVKGEENQTLSLTVGSTKYPRTATVTVTSDEVSEKNLTINISQEGVVEISTVSAVTATNLVSAKGTTATLNATFTGISLKETDSITAGFEIVADGQTKNYDATVSFANMFFTADLTGLVPAKEYSCTPWAKLNDDPAVKGQTSVFKTEKIPASIKSVGVTTVSNISSETGTTATFESSFVGVSIDESDNIKAGFTVSAAGSEVASFDATLDGETFSAEASGLTAGTEYNVVAWVVLNSGAKVSGEAATFTPKVKAGPVTYVFKFTGSAWSALPTSAKNVKNSEIKVIDGGYTFICNGCFMASSYIRIGSSNKVGLDGYIILPQVEGTVTSITVPNEGSGKSGSCRLAFYVSTDGGSSWSVIPGCEGITPTEPGTPVTLSGQKPNSLYKIVSVLAGGKQGNSQSGSITITAE